MTKQCKGKCKEQLPCAAFGRDASKEDNLNIYCRNCNNSKGKLRDRNKEQEYKLKKRYGISLDEYISIFIGQGGLCKVCCKDTGKLLVVDHCHSSLEVRGLLCGPCNLGLGMFYDDKDNLRRAIKYLKESE